jgi:hypothetical protein
MKPGLDKIANSFRKVTILPEKSALCRRKPEPGQYENMSIQRFLQENKVMNRNNKNDGVYSILWQFYSCRGKPGRVEQYARSAPTFFMN